MKAKAQEMCVVINEYAAKHEDKRISMPLDSIRMENFVIRKESKSFSFGKEWYFEPKYNRLYYQGGQRLSRVWIEFEIDFENVGDRLVVTNMTRTIFHFL